MYFSSHLSEKLNFEGMNIYYYYMIRWYFIDYQLVIINKKQKSIFLFSENSYFSYLRTQKTTFQAQSFQILLFSF